MEQIKYDFDFYLDGKDFTQYLSGLGSLSLGSSIYSLYPTAVMSIYLPPAFIESGVLSIGSEAKFVFYVNNKKIEKTFKVWKFELLTENNTRAMAGVYSISFIDPWYFKQEAKCKAYIGSSEIVLYRLLVDEFFNEFNKIDIDRSIDFESKHYRTYLTTGDFIERRLLDKFLVDNSPTFIYVNDSREFHAHSFNTMLQKKTGNIAVDTRNVELDSSILKDSKELDRAISPMNISYTLNKSGDLWNKTNTKTTVLNSINQTVKPLTTLSSSSSLFGTEGFYPVHSSLKEIDYPLSVYIDDSENELDHIYSSFLTKQKEIILDQSFTLTALPNFTIKVGESIDLYLKKENNRDILGAEMNSIFCSSYLITAIKHIYYKTSMITQFVLSRDIIKPLNKESLLDNIAGFIS
jgi:hypothetical protein